MKIAVCLISRDRYDYTRATVESFLAHNAGLDLILLQADDCSVDPCVRAKEFDQVNRHQKPRGGQEMRRIAGIEAARRGATHLYILENDIETVRPLPMEFLHFAFKDSRVFCVRLYGQYKERGEKRGCSKKHLGYSDKRLIEWRTYPNPYESAEIGRAHWGAQPCVTRIDEFIYLHEDTRSESQIWRKTTRLSIASMDTVRLLNNVTYHIGEGRTPGFIA